MALSARITEDEFYIFSVSDIDQTRENRSKPPFLRKKWHKSRNKVTLLRKSAPCPIFRKLANSVGSAVRCERPTP